MGAVSIGVKIKRELDLIFSKMWIENISVYSLKTLMSSIRQGRALPSNVQELCMILDGILSFGLLAWVGALFQKQRGQARLLWKLLPRLYHLHTYFCPLWMLKLFLLLREIGNLFYQHLKFFLGLEECPTLSHLLRHNEICWSNRKRQLCCFGKHRLPKQPTKIKSFFTTVWNPSPSVALDEVKHAFTSVRGQLRITAKEVSTPFIPRHVIFKKNFLWLTEIIEQTVEHQPSSEEVFQEQSFVHLTKTCSSSALSTGGGPIGDFKNLLVCRNRKFVCRWDVLTSLILFRLYTTNPPESLVKLPVYRQRFKQWFYCYINHRRCNPAHVYEERIREISSGIFFGTANNCRNERSWHASYSFSISCQLRLNFIKTISELKLWFVDQ